MGDLKRRERERERENQVGIYQISDIEFGLVGKKWGWGGIVRFNAFPPPSNPPIPTQHTTVSIAT